jgi:hypothetical protein
MKTADYAIAANYAYIESVKANYADDVVAVWLTAEQAFQSSIGTLVDTQLAWATPREAAEALRQRRLTA